MIEFDLRRPVARWLLSRGLTPLLECASLRNCDLVGVRFERFARKNALAEMVAVELKLSDIAGVIRQCEAHFWVATEVYAALPRPSAVRNAHRFGGRIGLLAVDGEAVEVVHPSAREDKDLARWCNGFWRRREEYKWRILDTRMRRHDALELRKAANSEGGGK